MKDFKNLPLGADLIPAIQDPTPDYYCTWQTQLYATSDGKPAGQRACIGERALFGEERPYGWAYFYEKARGDLFLVMDDSWDVPLDGNTDHYGSMLLNDEKFSSSAGAGIPNEQALSHLSARIRAIGWRGLGGWVCAQESPLLPAESEDAYWTERLRTAEAGGLHYLKVDWGEKGNSLAFRKKLSALARRYAPAVTVEGAIVKEVIPYADTYRTYDVPAILSIPMTMEKLREFLDIGPAKDGFAGLLNCEDEVYIAAALGCAMGIMRHPYVGDLPNGRPDPSFPDCHRRIKTKMAEVVRAVNFHKIAPAFGVNGEETYCSEEMLTDFWTFADRDAEIEAWWFDHPVIRANYDGETVSIAAPAAISRRMPPPTVLPDAEGEIPFTVAAKNPNGTVSVATCGRTRGRRYDIPACRVEIEGGEADTFGIFGEYRELCITFSHPCRAKKVLAQDLAGSVSYDITDLLTFAGEKVTVPGDLIHAIGTAEQDAGDTSEPGLVIKFFA